MGSNSADGFALEAVGVLSSDGRNRLLGLVVVAVGLPFAVECVGEREREVGVAGIVDDGRNDSMPILLRLL